MSISRRKLLTTAAIAAPGGCGSVAQGKEGANVTATQFRAALDKLGLSQLGAARLVGADGRTARRWALGERSVPTTVAILLRLMLAGKITAEDIGAVTRP